MDLNGRITRNGETTELPMLLLTAEEAQVIRDYSEWAAAQGYQATMICGDCGHEMEVYVQGDIGLFCTCRGLYHKAS